MNERSIEVFSLLGLGVLFIVLALWVRRRRSRERRRPVLAPPEFYERFEVDALAVAEGVLEFAGEELSRQIAAITPRADERPAPSGAAAGRSGVSVVRATLTGLSSVELAARDLAAKLRQLRSASEQDAERIEAEWNYLTTALTDRFPILARMAHDADLPGLERMSVEPAAALAELEQRRRELEEARSVLAQDRSLVWSQITLVVLTITVREGELDEAAAAASQVNPRPTALREAELLQAALRFALRVFHSTPAQARKMHDGVPVPEGVEPGLAAALVRHRVSEALTGGPLERARALTVGEPSLLWLGVPVVNACEYPQRAAEVFGKLAHTGRALVRGVEEGDGESARRATEELRELAGPLLGVVAAEDVAAAAAELALDVREREVSS